MSAPPPGRPINGFRYGCICGRAFTTKAGRTRHMQRCAIVPAKVRGWLGNG